jgi:hypothetical protein
VLWSDPDDEPSKELREALVKLRRLGVVIALATVLVMLALW